MEVILVMLGASIKRNIFLGLVVFQSSCALHFTDQEGNDNHIGFVSIKTEKNNCVLVNTVKSVGVSLDLTSDSGGLNLGISSTSKSYIKQNDYIELEEHKAGVLAVKKYNKSLQRTHENCAAE